jgi:hypothetical protein
MLVYLLHRGHFYYSVGIFSFVVGVCTLLWALINTVGIFLIVVAYLHPCVRFYIAESFSGNGFFLNLKLLGHNLHEISFPCCLSALTIPFLESIGAYSWIRTRFLTVGL